MRRTSIRSRNARSSARRVPRCATISANRHRVWAASLRRAVSRLPQSRGRTTMYRYDEFDAKFVAERVEQFRGQVARRLSGELNEEQFKLLRLMNGLYLQLHAYMLRIAVPYGTLAAKQLGRAHV